MICHGEMTRVERGSGSVWECRGCGGHALIDSTLRKLLPREVWQEIWPAIRAAVAPGRKRCPSCAQRMEHTTELPHLDQIQLDYCDSCRLIWLDPQEREKLPPPTPSYGISPELREAIRERGVLQSELESQIGALTGRALFELALWALL